MTVKICRSTSLRIYYLIILQFCVIGILGPQAVVAQANRIIQLEDWTYTYITRLQRRGHLLSLHPTALPYTQGEVSKALEELEGAALSPVETRWVTLLKRELDLIELEDDEAIFGVELGTGIRSANTERLDVTRPLKDDIFVYPNIYLNADLQAGPFIAHLGPRHDVYYDRDPDGIDAANRFMVRSDNSYIGYNGSFVSAYLGRFSDHWSQYGESAVLVSNNPRTYDKLNLRIGGQRFSVRAVLGELDSITANGEFTGRAGSYSTAGGSKRRFLVVHRWDWRPSRKLSLTLMEASLYSSTTSSVTLKYLNPVHPFIFLAGNAPMNDDSNAFFAGIMWAQFNRITVHGQIAIDDFDAIHGDFPLAFSLIGSLHYGGLTPNADLGLTFEAVGSQTYNTSHPEGKYLFLKRGLATQFNDYVSMSAFLDLYFDSVLPGLMLTPRLNILAQGERDIRQPNPCARQSCVENSPSLGKETFILYGTVERTIRPALQLFYQTDPRWWIRMDVGLNLTTNEGHVEGMQETRLVGMIEVGGRIYLNRAVRLPFK